jgi:hypothetical protein
MDKNAVSVRLGLTLLLAACLVTGCVHTMHTLTVNYKLALPSGEQVIVTDAHGDSFVDVNHVQRHVYYIMYETSHDMQDIAAMKQEALRVWAAYKPQIIGVDYDSVVVTPTKQDAGGDIEGRPNYLKRMPDDTWQVQ